MNVKTSNNRIFTNTILLYIRMVFVLLVSLYTTRLVLNILGIEDYGIYNVVSGFVSLFSFLSTSLANGIQRFYNNKIGIYGDSATKNVFVTSCQIQICVAIIIVIILETLGLWYVYNKLVVSPDRLNAALYVYQISIASLVVVMLQVPFSAIIIAKERMGYYAIVSIFDALSKLILLIWISYIHYDKLIMYSMTILCVNVINFILYSAYCRKKYFIKINKVFDKKLFIEMFKFSGWNTFGTFAYVIKDQGVNVLLNAFFGYVVNAARGISNMIMSAIQGFQANIVLAFRPQVVQSYAIGNFERVKFLFFTLSKVSFVILYSISLPVILETNTVLSIWLGSNIPDYTISFTILTLITMIISSLNTPVSQVIHATGKMASYQFYTSLIIICIFPISFLALKLGAPAIIVYWIALIITLINQIVCLILLHRVFEYHYSDYIKKVVLPCTLFAIVVLVLPILCHFCINHLIIRFILVIIFDILSVIVFGYIFVLTKAERQFIINLFKNKRNGHGYTVLEKE